MGLAEKRQQVMLTHRKEIYIPDNDQLITIFCGVQRDMFSRIDTDTCERLEIKISNSVGRFPQALAIKVLADSLENQPGALLNFFPIDRFPGLCQTRCPGFLLLRRCRRRFLLFCGFR